MLESSNKLIVTKNRSMATQEFSGVKGIERSLGNRRDTKGT